MPAGTLVTVPSPVPLILTFNVKVEIAKLAVPEMYKTFNPVYYVNEGIRNLESMQLYDGSMAYWFGKKDLRNLPDITLTLSLSVCGTTYDDEVVLP